jgi:hypothetical protein
MKARPKRAMLAIMVNPDDLDVLRAIFGQTPEEAESANLAMGGHVPLAES